MTDLVTGNAAAPLRVCAVPWYASRVAGLEQFMRYFGREDVSELILATGEVIQVRVGGGLHPLTKQPLTEPQIASLLAQDPLRRGAPPHDDPGRPERVDLYGSTYGLWVSREAGQLRIRILRDRKSPAAGTPATASVAPPASSRPLSSAPAAAPAARPNAAAAGPPAASQIGGYGSHDIDPGALDPSTLMGRPAPAAPRPSVSPPQAPPAASAPPVASSVAPPPPQAAPPPRPSTAPPRQMTSRDEGLRAYVAEVKALLYPDDLHNPRPEESRVKAPTIGATAPPEVVRGDGAAWATVRDPELILAAILKDARLRGASDIVVSSNRPAMIRICGALEAEGPVLSHDVASKALLALLNDHRRDQLERLGYTDFALALPGAGRIRVNVGVHRAGIKGVFRLVMDRAPSLEDLGMPSEILKVTQYHQGLAIISGPNGHGKTTTMAAIVGAVVASRPAHIITVEDPIEIVFDRGRSVVSQREVGVHTRSFHSALKAALREDPDVIVIGELRDRETVEMALSAAETGHLVIATMSTPSGAKTIDRVIDLFPPDDQSQVRATLAGALKIVVSQRLLPRADGSGMIAAAELISGGVALWTLIRDKKLHQLPSLMQRGRAFGMMRLEDSLRAHIEAGLIEESVAATYADDPRLLRAGGTVSPAASDGVPTASTQDPASGIAARIGGMFQKRS